MKDRLLNILLVTLVLLLAANLFLPKPAPDTANSDPHFKVVKSDLVVPNIAQISVANPTDQAFSFDTCHDLSVLRDGAPVTIDGAAAAFCKPVSVPAKGETKLDLSALAPLFTSPADYGFRLKVAGKELSTDVTVSERGYLRILLATIFYQPVLNLFVLLLLTLPGHSLGLAIVSITILVRLILLVPQHHMLVSSRKLQALQPHIKNLQQQHKDDQAKMGAALMELYKREKVNPLGSCLPLLFQMPVLIVLYWVLTGILDASNRFYFYPPFASFDTSSIGSTFLGMDLLAKGGVTGLALALLVGFAQWNQIRLSQKGRSTVPAAPRDPESLAMDPELMNRFMLWMMPAMIAVSTFFFPAGVGVYWLIGTLFMLAQQHFANRAVERKKA